MKSLKRAQRRHDAARLKKKRVSYWGQNLAREPRLLGKALHTATPCSCWMCGNPRKHTGLRTIQERREFEAGLRDAVCDTSAMS